MLNSFSKRSPENSGGAEKSAEISGTNGINFFAICMNLVYDIQSGYWKLTSSLVTVYSICVLQTLPTLSVSSSPCQHYLCPTIPDSTLCVSSSGQNYVCPPVPGNNICILQSLPTLPVFFSPSQLYLCPPVPANTICVL